MKHIHYTRSLVDLNVALDHPGPLQVTWLDIGEEPNPVRDDPCLKTLSMEERPPVQMTVSQVIKWGLPGERAMTSCCDT